MGPTQPSGQNSFLEGSFLGSKYLDPNYLFDQGATLVRDFVNVIFGHGTDIAEAYNTVLFFFSLFFLTVISYTIIRLFEIRKKEHAHLKQEIAEYAHRQAEKERKAQESNEISRNPRWVKTLNYLLSHSEGDWKLAVIEADSILDDMMTDLGFQGESLGEKLKSATQDRFRYLTSAWEVHTLRNKIAHEGSSFELTSREAKRAIALYEEIFRGFGYI